MGDGKEELGLGFREDLGAVTLWASALLVLTGSCFQFGYFYVVGLNFLSMTGPTDWLVAIGILAIPVVACGGLAFMILMRYPSDKFAWFMAAWFLSPIWLFALFLTIDNRSFMPLLIVLMVFTIVRRFSWHARDLKEKGSLTARDMSITLVLWAYAMLGLGIIYADAMASSCFITDAEGKRSQTLYMRSLGDGHLMREADRVVYVPKDQVRRIECGANNLLSVSRSLLR